MLLLQLRQADPSVVHNPYWWIARARLEEEARNKPEVLQLFEQAIKECHTDAYAMVRFTQTDLFNVGSNAHLNRSA